MKVAELDAIVMKKANLNSDFAQLGLMPDTSIQEASHFLLITSWKLLLKHSELDMRSLHRSESAGCSMERAWQPWKELQGGIPVNAGPSKSTGHVTAENTCNHSQ